LGLVNYWIDGSSINQKAGEGKKEACFSAKKNPPKHCFRNPLGDLAQDHRFSAYSTGGGGFFRS
jgi:hypothetical protein